MKKLYSFGLCISLLGVLGAVGAIENNTVDFITGIVVTIMCMAGFILFGLLLKIF